MPLDTPQKIQHTKDVTARTFGGRQKTVVLVYASAGVYSYTAVSMIFRPEAIVDPQIPGAAGQAPGRPADFQAIAPLGTNFAGVVYIADTPTATSVAVQAAPKYEVIEALPVGMVPGGTHIRVILRRFR